MLQIESITPDKWEKYSFPDMNQSYLLSPYWADYLRALRSSTPFFVFGNGIHILAFKEALGGHQLETRLLTRMLIPLVKSFMGYFDFGSIGISHPVSPAVVVQALVDLEKFSRRNGCMLFAGKFFSFDRQFSQHVRDGLHQREFDVTDSYTFLIDLSPSVDELWKQFHRSIRKNIRKCEKDGIYIKEVKDEKDYWLFYDLISESRKNMGLRMFSRRNWQLNRDFIWKNGISSFFISFIENTPLACLGAIDSDNCVQEILSGTSDFAKNNSYFTGELIKWEIMKKAKKRHIHYYDLAGVDPHSDDPKIENIYRFKKKFGGELFPSLNIGRKQKKRAKIFDRLWRY